MQSLRTSFITPKLCHGPGRIVDDAKFPCPNERATFAECSALASKQGLRTHNLPSTNAMQSTLTRVQMGRNDPNSTISVVMQVNSIIHPNEHPYAHFQFVTRFIDPDHSTVFVTRVATQRIAISKDEYDYMSSLNDEVIPIVLAKEAAFRSMVIKGNEGDDRFNLVVDQLDVDSCAFAAQTDLDATVHAISKAYRSHMKSG